MYETDEPGQITICNMFQFSVMSHPTSTPNKPIATKKYYYWYSEHVQWTGTNPVSTEGHSDEIQIFM